MFTLCTFVAIYLNSGEFIPLNWLFEQVFTMALFGVHHITVLDFSCGQQSQCSLNPLHETTTNYFHCVSHSWKTKLPKMKILKTDVHSFLLFLKGHFILNFDCFQGF